MAPPRRPGRRDSKFDADAGCPKCGTSLEGLIRLQMAFGGMGAVLLPPRFECTGCKTVWEIADSPKQKGAVKLGSFLIVPVDTGEQN